MRHWGTAEGLPSLSVTALAKDAEGFLWIGTTNGLFRFDGRLFEDFPFHGSESYALPSRHVTALCMHRNLLLVGTKGGACSIDAHSRIKAINLPGAAERGAPIIRAFLWSQDSSVIITTENNTCIRLPAHGESRPEVMRFNRTAGGPAALLDMRDGTRVVCMNGTGLMIPGRGDFGTAVHGSEFPYPGHTLTAIHEVGPQRVLGTGWDNAIHLYDLRGMRQDQRVLPNTSAISYSDDEIPCSLPLPDGRFAIGTKRSGLFFFDIAMSEWSSNDPVLPGVSIQTMLFDDGLLWLGTTEGLYVVRVESNGQRILRLKNKQDDEQVRAIFRWPDGRIGAVGSLRVWRDVNDPQAAGIGPFTDRYGTLDLYSALAMPDDRLFIGSQRSIHRLDAHATHLHHVRRSWGGIRAENIASTTINSIAACISTHGSEIYWSAYGHGAFSMDPDAMEPAFTNNVQPHSGDHLVRRITIDRDVRIWQAGSVNGITEITRLLPCDSIIARYRAFAEGRTSAYPQEGLCISTPWSPSMQGMANIAPDGWDIIPAKDHGFWCSVGGALLRFEPNESAPYKVVAQIAGLQGLTLDIEGRVWGIAGGGLFCYDPERQHGVRFSTVLALNDLEGYPTTDADGRVWATNGEALLAVDPDVILREEAPPAPRFATLSLFDLRVDSLLSARAPELEHDRNYLFITPSVVDPGAGNEARFRYRIAGDNESWIDLGEGERIALTGLPPGRYTLELGAARTSSQRWATTTWSFVIRPPWWRTWWFMLLMLAWVATIGTFLVRYRLGQRLREQDMRDRLARDLHDDIGSTLGSISYFSELGKQQLDAADIEAARGVMERMGVRSREMIGRMSDIVWSVDPKHDGATSLVERMKLFAAETLATRDIALQFDTHEGVEGLKLDMAQRRELYLVLKEAMTNVAKHAACTRVKVTLERNHGTVRLVVEDDGKGLQRSKPDLLNGSGLSSMHKRAAALGGTLVVAEADGGGTRVILSVPLRGIAS